MTLRTDDRDFVVVQSADDFLILNEPATFPAGPAVLTVSVDGEEFQSVTSVASAKNAIRVYSGTPSVIEPLKVAE